MREMMPYIWIGIIIFAAALKLGTRSLMPVWLIPAGLSAFVLSLLETHVWLQALIFFAMTAILLVASKIFMKKIKKIKKMTKALAAGITGQTAIVTEEINNYRNKGAIRINGLAVSAKTEDDDVIYETGLIVTVISVEGGKAVCSR